MSTLFQGNGLKVHKILNLTINFNLIALIQTIKNAASVPRSTQKLTHFRENKRLFMVTPVEKYITKSLIYRHN